MSFELLDSNFSGSQNTKSIHSCSLLVSPSQLVFHWEARSSAFFPMEFSIYWTYSAFVSDFIPAICPCDWGGTVAPFHEKFRNAFVHWAMPVVTPQAGEQVKTNLLKQDRDSVLSIVKGLRKPSNREKQNVGPAKKSGQKSLCAWAGSGVGDGRAWYHLQNPPSLVFLPFPHGSKEQLESS